MIGRVLGGAHFALLVGLSAASAQTATPGITATEIKIAAFVEEGLSNPEIAARLLLSRRTVATHVSHILKKLDVNSRIDIARESARRTVPPR